MENLNDVFAAYPPILSSYKAQQVLAKPEIVAVFKQQNSFTLVDFYCNLQARLQAYAEAYYVQGDSKLADWDYDFAYRILECLTEEFSELRPYSKLTETVGAVSKQVKPSTQAQQLSFFNDVGESSPETKIVSSTQFKKEDKQQTKKTTTFNKEAHVVKLESLQDLFSKDELFQALDSMRNDLVSKGISASEVNKLGFSVEEKIDGLSLAVLYENGKLTKAVTRGNGLVGDNVTANALMLRNLPTNINCPLDLLEVRGEVYMPKAAFKQLNENLYADLLAKGLDKEVAASKLFANARNACVGSLKQKSARVTKERDLEIFIFNWQRASKRVTDSHMDSLHKLNEYGLPVVNSQKLYNTNEEIYAACQAILARREALSYGIDGAVIKLDNLKYRELLGSTAKTPRWAYAFKFPPEQVETKLLDIKVQVGRSGKLTPLAIVEAAVVQGSTIRKASLHNFDYLSKLDLRVGDTVYLHKAGDIIPEITGFVEKLRPKTAQAYIAPEICPICETELISKGQDLFCLNKDCPQQVLLRFAYFTSKEAMNIANLGEKTLEQFINEGFLKDLPDIYRLNEHYKEIATMKGFASVNRLNASGELELSVPKFDDIWQSILDSKHNSATRFLTALGLPELGVTMSRKLSKHFSNLANFFASSEEELLTLPDVGPTLAKSWSEIFASSDFKALVREFAKLGLEMLDKPWGEKIAKFTKLSQADIFYTFLLENDYIDENGNFTDQAKSNIFVDKKVVCTGTFSKYKRSELTKLLAYLGADVQSGINKQTNYLIVGEKAGSKLQKAEKLGIDCINEADFWQILAK